MSLPARHRPCRARRAVAADLRRARLDGGRHHRRAGRRRASAPLLGILSGYLGGWVDQVIMRITDTWLALPALTFAIFLAAIVGPSELNIIIILGLVYWTRYARVIRGEVLSLKQREFVRLAIVAGCSKRTIMWRHILPNVINSAIVLATLMLGVVIVTEASLSFLGVGVPPPKPAWGLMMADGKKGLMVGLLVAHGAPRHLHHADGAVGQPSGRLAAREARPAAAPAVKAVMSSNRCCRSRISRPTTSPQQGTRVVRAVDEVTLSLERRRDAGHRRRIGLGQEHARAHHPAPAAAGGAHRQRADDVRGRGPARQVRRRDAPACAASASP